MSQIRINGEDTEFPLRYSGTFGDLIELIKSHIDPDHMITSILLDGRELADQDWTAQAARFETSILEVETDTPTNFVTSRLIAAPDIIQACYDDFRKARKLFQEGDSASANKILVQAVNTFQAFFDWYGSLMELLAEQERSNFDISEVVRDISGICRQICQQQLYQSWWAIGESLKNELEPKLDELEMICRSFRKQLAA